MLTSQHECKITHLLITSGNVFTDSFRKDQCCLKLVVNGLSDHDA